MIISEPPVPDNRSVQLEVPQFFLGWRGFAPAEAEKEDEASLFAFFGLNTG